MSCDFRLRFSIKKIENTWIMYEVIVDAIFRPDELDKMLVNLSDKI